MTLQTMEPMNGKAKSYESELSEWINHERAAIELIAHVGTLWFDKSVELIIFRNQLIDRSASEIMNLHQYAKDIVKRPISVNDTTLLAGELSKLDLIPSRIDIGRLCAEWTEEHGNYKNVTQFVTDKMKDFIGKDKGRLTPKDVVLYGFGRIGRLAARELIAQAGKGEQLRLRAIVTRGGSKEEIVKRADLLRNDSVHGPFPGTILEDIDNNALIINGHTVHMISANNPEDVNYTKYGIHDALVIDNTGVFRDREGLGRHLKSKGVSKVLLTAPGKGDIPNIVYGVNHEGTDVKGETVFSAASCTTNAIMPILYVVEKELGVVKGHIETVHSYTNDQNLLDNYHKKYRRGRSAAMNMVITETGAESALKKVLPQLSGKFTANSVRVPTPNVSLAILNIEVKKEASKDEVNAIIKAYALKGDLVEQIQYSFSNELVSSDVIGNPCSSVFDSPATIVSADKKNIVLYVWYDNEYGYTRQVIRFSKQLAEVRRAVYY
ncbi:MAG: glyceraldehyde-3-phosphate dehydrogenase [Bacteroidetes bacterium]|nr:MAG: glyceraldehyde-3-phosphate dehydrogenase [Bacteroidota bacterium]